VADSDCGSRSRRGQPRPSTCTAAECYCGRTGALECKPKIASSGGVVGNQGLVRGSLLRRKFASAESPGFRVRATRIPGLGDSGCGSCCEQLWSRDLVLDSPSEATARRHLCEGSCRPEHQLGWRTRNQSVGQQAGQWGPKVGVQAPGRGNIRD
jgi:hypothetical protein